MTDIALLRPSLSWLPAYEDALARGWSPNTDQDVSREQLWQLRRNPERFLHDLYNSPMIRLADGREVPRLPAHDFWISDGEFCGRIGFRFQRGTEELPSSAYDNEASRKVILANGGEAAGAVPHNTRPGHVKLRFWVPTQ
jgi:predicted acetyltransferase